ncbi:MAG TPA: SRPBCC family protein [Candidatus Binatia bacterium]|nr:SRPBCC family protein [Candidatus Binatia bacterium]
MHSSVSIWIAAPPDRVFPLVAALDRWPMLLPHYRYVRVTGRSGSVVRARMSARRGPIPVFWEAEQTPDAASRTIRFRHVGGVTRGMDVLWTFQPERDGAREGTRATITHDLEFRFGPRPMGRFLAERVLAPQFIEPIAGATLRRFKSLAEAPETGRGALPADAQAPA